MPTSNVLTRTVMQETAAPPVQPPPSGDAPSYRSLLGVGATLLLKLAWR